MIKPRSVIEYQARVNALFNQHILVVDGLWGPKTEAAVEQAMREVGATEGEGIFDPSGIDRVHPHWTAGAYGVIGMERRAYNLLIDERGKLHNGVFPIEAQANYAVGRAASHTYRFNSHAAGVAVDCMADAKEHPFNAGSAPMSKIQLKGLVEAVAQICENYWIPVTRWSVPTHAEIQPTFGIRQKWKWDITWLPGMDKPGDAVVVGDKIREMIRAEMGISAESEFQWAA